MEQKRRRIWPVILLIVIVVFAALTAAAYFLIHSYSAPTCVSPAVCSICGKEKGRPAGHQWTEPSCVTEQFCKLCGETKESALGHDWVQTSCTEPAVCNRCGETASSAVGHDWLEVTCSAPATCSRCGETIGKALEHSWIGGTCVEPGVCEYCGEQSATVLGHDWQEATATAPRTCLRCGITDGTPLAPKPAGPIGTTSEPVEKEVEQIRAVYNEIVTAVGAGSYERRTYDNGTDAYYDGAGMLRCVIVYRGTEGIGAGDSVYSRTYYYEGGQLMFAFYEGSDAHRFYFRDGELIRWRYQAPSTPSDAAVNQDGTDSAEYLDWERIVLEESERYDDN